MLHRAFYHDPIAAFLSRGTDEIVGRLARSSPFADNSAAKSAWDREIAILRSALAPFRDGGKVYLEFVVPRLGRRIDAIVLLRNVVLVLEFKVGESHYASHALDQVCDYALDLKHFHETSHDATIAPILVATDAPPGDPQIAFTPRNDGVLLPIKACATNLIDVIRRVACFSHAAPIDPAAWESGRYSPTPTIIEAATALYSSHRVEDLARSDAGATNLARTSDALTRIMREAREGCHKAICFVTGVPGAGKTLVGLNTATQHRDSNDKLHSVFLSGNGPLVAILREALARDKAARDELAGRGRTLSAARTEVKAFIQNVHEFRDEYARHDTRAPFDHVVVFDEAQRAWDRAQTSSFMRRKRSIPGFSLSEPEFLISCMDRHPDWAVVVCLVGGGQEINTGEAGISEWVDSVLRSFPDWRVHISPHLSDSEYGAGDVLARLLDHRHVHHQPDLHLAVSMRSFRAEHVSGFVKSLLDQHRDGARTLLDQFRDRYPILLTRDAEAARSWLRRQARGSERYGLLASSQAQRLKPCPIGVDVRVQTDPVKYFLAPKTDVRSSFYLEDAATEFDVQGLELDWTGVIWDGDFRCAPREPAGGRAVGWGHFEFRGSDWIRVNKPERQQYLKNAYRVLLTRARQGMVVVVPEGSRSDPTRSPEYYDPTWEYLRSIGLEVL